MRRSLAGLLLTAVAFALLASPAAAGQLKAGAADVDASWHVGASAGQYASDGTPVDPANGNYDPYAHSTRRAPSYGIQSHLHVRALVIEGPSGNRTAIVKNDFYIPQDLIWRRAAQLLEAKPGLRIGKQNLTMSITHDHSSPLYGSTAWGVWTFQDVFDVRFYNYYAQRMAEAVEKAVANLKPARVGASVTQFDKTHRHSFGPARADDGTPAGYPNDNTDHDMTVVRFDDISDPAHPKPLANLVNFALHGEFLNGNDLISEDYLAPMEKMTDRATGALTVYTQGAVGTSEPERSSVHSIHERLEFTHREYGQAEYAGRLMSNAIVNTWRDIERGKDDPAFGGDPKRFVPFRSDFAANEVAERDRWFPGPLAHPYPGVSNCKTQSTLAGNPQLPVVGLPDCQGVKSGLDALGLGVVSDNVPDPPVDPGLTTTDFDRLGVPVPENYSAPGYTGLEEDIDIHLQAFRVGDILFTICSCEQWYDQSRNIKTRTDRTPSNEHLGYDWKTQCTPRNDGTYGGPAGFGTGTWSCPAPADPSAQLSDQKVQRMHGQVVNPANGWNDVANAATQDSEAANPSLIKGNYTHDDACARAVSVAAPGKSESDGWDKPCAPGEQSPSATRGYKLTVAISMSNDYNGYIATYREYQRGDHYRKALTAWGPHSSDYMASRLVNLGRALNGGDESKLLPAEYGDGKITADLAHNDARAQALGNGGEQYTAQYESKLPDDGGSPGAVTQPKDLERFAGNFFTWVGGSNYTDQPDVKVQRFVDGKWEDYDGQAGELPVTVKYPQGTDTPSFETGSFEWRWSAHFEAFAAPFDTNEGNRSTPVGTYRFVVAGHRREGGKVVPYGVESKTFAVRPWSGVTVNDLQRDGDGRASFRVGPRTKDKKHEDMDNGSQVTVPEVGPIDYPDSYTYGPGDPLPRFIKDGPSIKRDPAAPGDPSKGELYCFACRFRPWLDSGDADHATFAFVAADGSTRRVAATREGDRWRSDAPLAEGETAWVPRGCVQDSFGDFNGAGAGAGAGSAPAACAVQEPPAGPGDGGGGSAGDGGGPSGNGTLGPSGKPGGRRSSCIRATGRVRGRTLGRTRLGRRRAGQRKAFPSFTRPRRRVDRFCFSDGRHLRIGYRGDRAALLLVSSRHYAIRGVRPGSRLHTLRRRLPRLARFHIGANLWYVARGRSARLVFKVRRGRVLEVGLADSRRMRGYRATRRFLRSFS